MSAPVARKYTHGNHYIKLLARFRVLQAPDNNNGHGIGRGGGRTRNGYRKAFRRPTGRPGPGGTSRWGRAGRPLKYSSVRMEGIGTRTVVQGKGGGGETERQAPRSDEGPQALILLLLLRPATPIDASRNSRQSRGAPSPTPLHPHPNPILPATQVGEQAFIRRDAGQGTRSRALAGIQLSG